MHDAAPLSSLSLSIYFFLSHIRPPFLLGTTTADTWKVVFYCHVERNNGMGKSSFTWRFREPVAQHKTVRRLWRSTFLEWVELKEEIVEDEGRRLSIMTGGSRKRETDIKARVVYLAWKRTSKHESCTLLENGH